MRNICHIFKQRSGQPSLPKIAYTQCGYVEVVSQFCISCSFCIYLKNIDKLFIVLNFD